MKKTVLLFAFLSSCSTPFGRLTTKRVQQVEVYAIELTAHTKLPIDTVTVVIIGSHLFNVDNPDAFVTQLDRAVSHLPSLKYSNFRENFVRMAYKIKFQDGTGKSMFIDKGGKFMLLNNRVYKLGENVKLSRLIINSLPADSSKILSKEEKNDYRRQYYSPITASKSYYRNQVIKK